MQPTIQQPLYTWTCVSWPVPSEEWHDLDEAVSLLACPSAAFV